MHIIAPLQFFKTAFGLKEIVYRDQSFLVCSDYEAIPELMSFELKLSVIRQAALLALTKKLKDKHPPVFTQTDITEPLQQAFEMNYAMVLLESLELSCLAQAIVDDDRDTVKSMLDLKPELLLFQPDVIVTSQYTGQQFSVDGNFLGLACRRRQIEMVKIIKSAFERLQQNEAEIIEINKMRDEGLSEWVEYATDNNGQIKVPRSYQCFINHIILVCNPVNFPVDRNGNQILNSRVEEVMEIAYENVIQDFVLTKKNHWDVEMLLYAAYKTYEATPCPLETIELRQLFCIRMIGLLQSILSPETAKIFCFGLNNSIKTTQINSKANQLITSDNHRFYDAHNSARSSCGFKYFIGTCGRALLHEHAQADIKFGRFLWDKNTQYLGLFGRQPAFASHPITTDQNQESSAPDLDEHPFRFNFLTCVVATSFVTGMLYLMANKTRSQSTQVSEWNDYLIKRLNPFSS